MFSHCRWHDVARWVHKGRRRKNNFLLEELERHRVLLSFVVVVYAVLQEKFPAHPGGEGIMTGLLSGEEEVRAESQQSLLDGFSHTASISSDFI